MIYIPLQPQKVPIFPLENLIPSNKTNFILSLELCIIISNPTLVMGRVYTTVWHLPLNPSRRKTRNLNLGGRGELLDGDIGSKGGSFLESERGSSIISLFGTWKGPRTKGQSKEIEKER